MFEGAIPHMVTINPQRGIQRSVTQTGLSIHSNITQVALINYPSHTSSVGDVFAVGYDLRDLAHALCSTFSEEQPRSNADVFGAIDEVKLHHSFLVGV